MKHLSTISAFLIIYYFSLSTGFSQQTFTLNSIDSQAKQVNAVTISGKQHLRYYHSVEDEAIRHSMIRKGDRLEVQTSSSDVSTMLVTRIESYTDQTVSYLTVDENNPQNTFTFTWADGRLNGLFHKSHDDIYFFEYDSDVRQNYIAKSSSFYDHEQFCPLHELVAGEEPENFSREKSVNGYSGRSHIPTISALASSLDSETTIDILIPYTENARLWAEASTFESIDAVIANAMALSQTTLDNSEIYITLRLVHYYETSYDGDTLENLDENDDGYVSEGDHLRRLTRNPNHKLDFCGGSTDCSETDFDGYMEEVHQLRDEYGADLVAAVMSEPNTGGLAWRGSSIAGSPSWGFSINRVQQIGTGYTLIHEIGHNMGNAHARNQNQSAAGDFGGVFAYSTGNRFSSTSKDNATVMAYAQDGYIWIPYFSNPNVQYSGTNTGNPISYTGEAGPSDNARSMREMKRVIASYRPTMIDPPVVDVEESSISANLNQENRTVTVPVTIRNHGDSDLMWDLDFDIESGVLSKHKRSTVTEVTGVDPDFQHYEAGNIFSEATADGVIFSTNFEGSEGFAAGDHAAIGGWRSRVLNTPFKISDENPSAGSYHLRLPRRSESSSSVGARSPFFGPQPMGEFSVTFDLAVNNLSIGGDGEVFDVYIYDASTSSISAGIIISDGYIYARTVNENGEEVFGFAQATFPEDATYQSMEIKFNPNNQTIDYYMNGTQLVSNPYPGGRKPDHIYFGHRNEVSGAYMDVDNVEVTRIHTPFNWLNVSRTGGVVAPSSSQTVDLTLTAEDVETGSYQTVLQVRSNDPGNPVIEVPISAEIELATSAGSAPELPGRVTLSQNYPNPFNPSTRIRFNLNQAADVKLEVFNIAGQKVATLLQETLNAGLHVQTFDASNLASGVYIYRLQTPSETLTRQMILIK